MDDWRTHDTFSSSGSSSEPLNFARERHVLSTISERTEDSSISSAGMLQSLLTRPASYLSSAAASSAEAIRRSLYGAPPSPTLHTRASTDPGHRPVTPDRPAFRPAPPTGRRAGDLIAFFEDKTTEVSSSPSHTRNASYPLGPRSPSPFSQSSSTQSGSRTPLETLRSPTYDSLFSRSRPSSPFRSSRTGQTSTVTPSQTLSSLLSPPQNLSTFSRRAGSPFAESESNVPSRSRSPLSSVRNVVAGWQERAPSIGLESIRSGSTITSPTTPLGLTGGIFSLRRRGGRVRPNTLTEGSEAEEPFESGDRSPPPYEEFGSLGKGNGNGSGSEKKGSDRRSAGGGSRRSASSSAPFDMSELGSFARGSQEVNGLSRRF